MNKISQVFVAIALLNVAFCIPLKRAGHAFVKNEKTDVITQNGESKIEKDKVVKMLDGKGEEVVGYDLHEVKNPQGPVQIQSDVDVPQLSSDSLQDGNIEDIIETVAEYLIDTGDSKTVEQLFIQLLEEKRVTKEEAEDILSAVVARIKDLETEHVEKKSDTEVEDTSDFEDGLRLKLGELKESLFEVKLYIKGLLALDLEGNADATEAVKLLSGALAADESEDSSLDAVFADIVTDLAVNSANEVRNEFKEMAAESVQKQIEEAETDDLHHLAANANKED